MTSIAVDHSISDILAAQHPDVVKKITEILETARVDSPDFPVRSAADAKRRALPH